MHLFLSPHYDDAIYSCGGLIHQLTQQGEAVLIFTIMAGEPLQPLPDTPVMEDNHQRWEAGQNPVMTRRTEDQAAAQIVGAETLYNDLPDCIYRTHNGVALYPSEESLWGPVHRDDPAVMALQVLGLVYGDAETIYAPLAVGNHVDHLIVRDWAQLLEKEYPVKYYTDYPYLRDEEAIKQALEHFKPPLKPQTTTLSEADMAAKVKAMAAYVTQIKSFWADADAIDSQVRQTFTDSKTGQFVERLWQR